MQPRNQLGLHHPSTAGGAACGMGLAYGSQAIVAVGRRPQVLSIGPLERLHDLATPRVSDPRGGKGGSHSVSYGLVSEIALPSATYFCLLEVGHSGHTQVERHWASFFKGRSVKKNCGHILNLPHSQLLVAYLYQQKRARSNQGPRNCSSAEAPRTAVCRFC